MRPLPRTAPVVGEFFVILTPAAVVVGLLIEVVEMTEVVVKPAVVRVVLRDLDMLLHDHLLSYARP